VSLAQLPPYSGEGPLCVKCGNDSARTEYRPLGECIHNEVLEYTIGFSANERLHRECRRCGYQWDEALAVVTPGEPTGTSDSDSKGLCACIGVDCAEKGCWAERQRPKETSL